MFFVEKEGFSAQFEETQIAERFDLAFMSCKGVSVVAARELADMICHAYNLPLYLLTDFDKSGMTGPGTFERTIVVIPSATRSRLFASACGLPMYVRSLLCVARSLVDFTEARSTRAMKMRASRTSSSMARPTRRRNSC